MAKRPRLILSRAGVIAPAAIVCVLALPLTAAPLAADTRLVMTSEPGDYIGGGQSHYYDASTGAFTLGATDSYRRVNVYYSDAVHWWYLDFAALAGNTLQPGTYVGATRYPFQDPTVPGLNVSGDGRGCNTLTGDFRVRAVTYFGSNAVTAFWAEFEQHCEGGPAALRGEIRFNVTPLVVCNAPLRVAATAGQATAFDVTAQHPGILEPAQILAYGVPAGATLSAAGPDSARLTWFPGAADLGTHVISFVAVDSMGRRDSISTIVQVAGETSLRIVGEAGDPVAGAGTRTLVPADYNFFVRRYAGGALDMYLSQRTGPYETWSADFLAPGDVAPGPGFYPDAVGYPSAGNTAPELRVARNSNSCYTTSTGEYQVKVASYGAGETVNQCWVRFAQRCSNGSGWLSGELRWNIAPPVAVVVPMRASVRAGTTLHLRVGGQADGGEPVTFSGVGLPAGASLASAGPDSATLEWTPPVGTSGAYRFTIVGQNPALQTDSAIVTVEVTGESHFTATSDPGDPIGSGQSYDLDAFDGAFTAGLNGPNGVGISLDVANDFNDWSFYFAVPGGGPVVPGTYLDAASFPGSGSTPGMSVNHNYTSCSMIRGDFRIREFVASGGIVQRFRAEFDQRCGNTAAALRGEIRYNSNVPIDLRAPIRKVASRGFPISFPVTATSPTGATVTLGAVSLPSGATFDASGGSGTFQWTPGFGQSGMHAITFFANGSDGAIDSVVTWVQVAGVYSLAIAGEPGDPITNGSAIFYGPNAASFLGSPYTPPATVTIVPLVNTAPWTVGFMGPGNQPLVPGFYFDAQSLSSGDTSRPRVSITGPFVSCYGSSGRFEIKQIGYLPGGELRTLWARFLQRCDSYNAGLTGEIRFNADVRVTVAAPFELEYEQGQSVAFAIKGTDALGRAVTLSATGLPPGASFVDHGNDTGDLTWTPTFEQFGRYPVVFRAVNPDGDADSVVTEIRLVGRRLWTLHSDPGDVIGNGLEQRFESTDGVFGAFAQSYDGNVTVSFDPSPTEYGGEWSANFRMPFGTHLAPGVYRDARDPTTASGQPRLFVQGPYGYCYERRGQFRIRSAVYDSAGRIQSLRADFDQYCGDSTAGLHGSVIHRANAYVIVDAPISAAVRPGDPLALDVRGEDAAGAPVTLTALDLPPGATFADHGDGTGAMAWTPSYANAGLHYPRFVARNGAGAADTVVTEIRVVGITFLTISSDPGDPVGGGQPYNLTDADATFRLVRNAAGGVSATIDPPGQVPTWELHFAPPAADDLLPGDYPLALRYPFQEPTRPGLWVTSGASCPSILGSFTIRHLDWGSGGEVASFWATFEQHCNGMSPALRGQLLYNLDVAVPVEVALVSAEARDDRVELQWFAADDDGLSFALERHDGDRDWVQIAVLHADGAGHIEYTDREVAWTKRYGYRLVVNENGSERVFGEVWVQMPDAPSFALEGLRPNPAPGDLTVAFTLPRAGRVRVQLLDIAGRAVVDRSLDAGSGRHLERVAARGEVPAGLYLVRLDFDGEQRTRAGIVVR